MSYELTDYQGNKILLPDDKATKIAGIAQMIEVEVAGRIHYINPSNIASIRPMAVSANSGIIKAREDYRETISADRFAELKKRLLNKK